MIVKKADIIAHLERIHMGGQITEAVFYDKFACDAISVDRAVLVSTKGIQSDPLPQPVGVMDLKLLITALKSLGDDTEGNIALDFVGDRIVIEERGRGVIRMVTSSPATIATQIKPETLEKIQTMIGSVEGYILPQAVVGSVTKTQNLLKADEVRVIVDPALTSLNWIIGKRTSNFAEVPMTLGVNPAAAEKYELVFDPNKIIAVLDQVVDFTHTHLILTGPASLISVKDLTHTYVLSPQIAPARS
jgi:hypothetical protein